MCIHCSICKDVQCEHIQQPIISPVTVFKKLTKDLFYLCSDTTEMREIKLRLFQTFSRGVPKLHYHGLLALVKEPIMCP